MVYVKFGVSQLSQLEIDETGRLIPAIPLTIDGVVRTIPVGHHTQIITAHGKKFSVINGGKLIVNGCLTYYDLGD